MEFERWAQQPEHIKNAWAERFYSSTPRQQRKMIAAETRRQAETDVDDPELKAILDPIAQETARLLSQLGC